MGFSKITGMTVLNIGREGHFGTINMKERLPTNVWWQTWRKMLRNGLRPVMRANMWQP